jgi:glycogen debranching enzyme
MGPFVEAWLRVHGSSARARLEARERFLSPLLELAAQTGGHLPEIADGDAPYAARGCPAQAWSVSEVLRVDVLLTERTSKGRARAGKAQAGPVAAAV